MQRLNLDFEKRSYDIVIDTGFDALADELVRVCKGKILIVSDTNVAPIYLSKLEECICKAGFAKPGHVIFEAGEKSKNIDTLQKIYNALVEHKLDRKSAIIALGGGVVGDMAGLAAATYMRGIDFVQIPTTLLAQTDSSVGGKVGIDFSGVKNIIGAFKQPSLVYINTSTLKTLPKREFSAGMAEVIKYGVIRDDEFLSYLEENVDEILSLGDKAIENVIYKCCAIKADVVMHDETEMGMRAILNFGHTIGHGVESAKNFELLHGECVALGMVGALDISLARGYVTKEYCERVKDIISSYALETSFCGAGKETVIEYMQNDKKKMSDKLRFVLIKGMGETVILDDITKEETEHAIECIIR